MHNICDVIYIPISCIICKTIWVFILCWENKTRKKTYIWIWDWKTDGVLFFVESFFSWLVCIADFVFLEQHKSLLTDFNGRIAQNCCLCSYTKINETVLLSLPSSPFLVCSEIYMYVETHASPPGHSKLRATLLFFLRWKAGAISFFGQKSKYIRKLNQPY